MGRRFLYRTDTQGNKFCDVCPAAGENALYAIQDIEGDGWHYFCGDRGDQDVPTECRVSNLWHCRSLVLAAGIAAALACDA